MFDKIAERSTGIECPSCHESIVMIDFWNSVFNGLSFAGHCENDNCVWSFSVASKEENIEALFDLALRSLRQI